MTLSLSSTPHSGLGTAPGKVILVGEHAVVYGRPAIAVPVWENTATAAIHDAPVGSGCTIIARDIDQRIRLIDAPVDEALALITRLTLEHLALPTDPDWYIDLHSDIPIASGLGSGAAISAALVRAIHERMGQAADPATVSQLVFESERLFHGTPSGIDNTVIVYGRPVWFVKGQTPQVFTPHTSFTLAIADSGLPSPTKETVGDVRQAWRADAPRYEQWFDEIALIAEAARGAIEHGNVDALGPLFDQNQQLLAQIGVSSERLDTLIRAAREAGAHGAKLSGGGRGGNVIAVVQPHSAEMVKEALLEAGAKRVIVTTVLGR